MYRKSIENHPDDLFEPSSHPQEVWLFLSETVHQENMSIISQPMMTMRMMRMVIMMLMMMMIIMIIVFQYWKETVGALRSSDFTLN